MMKRLLFSVIAAGGAVAAVAANQSFFGEELGDMYGVSDNGTYAAISDVENLIAYLWDANNPNVFTDISCDKSLTADMPASQRVKGTSACDISDSGIVVGSIYYADGHEMPAYYNGTEWTVLPVLKGALNTNEAIAITPDGKTIAGYNFIGADNSLKGGYVPVQWTLQPDGTYKLKELECISDILAYEHQGFYPMAQTDDGRGICGSLYCGASSIIPAIVLDGKLKVWHKFEIKEEPFIFAGKYFCGYDTAGNQVWTKDPEDPRIQLFSEYYIDGMHDEASGDIQAYLNNVSGSRWFYGNFAKIENVVDGVGDVTTTAAIYDLETDEWILDPGCGLYAGGVGKDLIFADYGKVIIDGQSRMYAEEYDINAPSAIAGINRVSANGGVLGGNYYTIHPGTGEAMYYPFVTITEAGVSGVNTVYGGSDVFFSVAKGEVAVRNAESMEVYDLDGRLVASGSEASLQPGVYVLKAGDKTAKVQVK